MKAENRGFPFAPFYGDRSLHSDPADGAHDIDIDQTVADALALPIGLFVTLCNVRRDVSVDPPLLMPPATPEEAAGQ